jgi:hypothetical protein
MLLGKRDFFGEVPELRPWTKNAKAAGPLLPGFACARVFGDAFIALPFAESS